MKNDIKTRKQLITYHLTNHHLVRAERRQQKRKASIEDNLKQLTLKRSRTFDEKSRKEVLGAHLDLMADIGLPLSTFKKPAWTNFVTKMWELSNNDRLSLETVGLSSGEL